MKKLMICLLVFCSACESTCESENITRCGYACELGHTRMASYNKSSGCVYYLLSNGQASISDSDIRNACNKAIKPYEEEHND